MMKRNNPEGQIQLTILKEMRWRGYYCAKLKVKGGFKANGSFIKDFYACVGLPDLICFVPDPSISEFPPLRLGFIEVKSKIGVQSQSQKDFEELCKKSNTPYVLARDWETVKTAFNLA